MSTQERDRLLPTVGETMMKPPQEVDRRKGLAQREAFNPLRRFMKAKGIRGKDKKRFRKVQRERARAKFALEQAKKDKQTAGGLLDAGQGL